jgi:nucleoid-associated protein YgaU
MKRTLALFGLGVLLLWSFGCSGSKGIKVNISEGEYYSEDEYAELSKGDKEAYCEALGKELALLKKGNSERESKLKATKEQIEKLKSELEPLEAEILRIDSDVRSLNNQVKELEALPKNWVIKPGECLWTIAGYGDVYSDPVKWPRIYRANTDRIEDPAYIYPDTVLTIPRDWPASHTVETNECLWLIAGYWEIYDTPWEWPKIFEANKDKIVDPDLIQPQQVLTIPR